MSDACTFLAELASTGRVPHKKSGIRGRVSPTEERTEKLLEKMQGGHFGTVQYILYCLIFLIYCIIVYCISLYIYLWCGHPVLLTGTRGRGQREASEGWRK